MDKKFLKENNLLGAQQQFQKLYEYTFIGNTDLRNEDDEEGVDDTTPPLDNNGDDNLMGNPTPNQDDNTPPSNEPLNGGGEMGDNENSDDNGGVEGFDPQIEDNEENGEGFKGGEFKEDEEVIDVDDLTKAQEDTKNDVSDLSNNLGGVSRKLDNLMDYMTKVETFLKQRDGKIDDLRAEMERRNPTQIEKLNNQASLSYPFNVKPEEYWKEKEETSNYRITDDNNDEDQGQYVITKQDVDGDVNWKQIADSFKTNKNLNQNLSNIFNI